MKFGVLFFCFILVVVLQSNKCTADGTDVSVTVTSKTVKHTDENKTKTTSMPSSSKTDTARETVHTFRTTKSPKPNDPDCSLVFVNATNINAILKLPRVTNARYQIKTNSSVPESPFDTSNTTFTIKGLSPGNNYHFDVYLKQNTILSENSCPLDITTKPNDPDCSSVFANATNNNAILKLPRVTNARYQIKTNLSVPESPFDTSNTTFTIKGLSPGNNYHFDVYLQQNTILSENSCPLDITTKPNDPDCSLVFVNATNINAILKLPRVTNARYQIKTNSSVPESPFDTSNTTFTIKGLSPGNNYHFDVYLKQNTILSENSCPLDITTKPNDPDCSLVFVNATNINAILKLPRVTNARYQIKTNSSVPESPFDTSNTTFTIKGLSPGNNYHFDVYLKQNTILSENSCPLDITTKPNDPDCSSVFANATNNNAILKLPRVTNARYHIKTNLSVPESPFDTSNTTFTIKGLSPGNNYHFDVYLQQNTILSENSCPLDITTKPNDPDCSSVFANATNNNAILKLPRVTNARYQIKTNSSVPESPFDTSNTTFTIKGLSPGNNYHFDVYLKQNTILSENSCPLDITTRPSNPICSQAATTNITDTGFVLQLPIVPEGASHLNISETLHNGHFPTQTNKTQTTVRVNTLSPGQTYHFVIIATNGDSVSSGDCHITVTTRPTDPDCLTNRISEITNSSIILQLPSLPEGATLFQINVYSTSGNNSDTSIRGGTKTFQPLNPGTTYRFEIIAQHATTESFRHCHASATTKPADPQCSQMQYDKIVNTKVNIHMALITTSIDGYTLSIDPRDVIPKFIYNTSNITVSGLQPGKIYTINIFAIKHNITSVDSCAAIIKTRPVTPLQVTADNIKDSNKISTAVDVSWKLSERFGSISSYKVTAVDVDGYDSNVTVSYTGNDHETTVNGLAPGHCYNIQVITISNGIDGYPQTSSSPICTYPVIQCDKSIFTTVTNESINIDLRLVNATGEIFFQTEKKITFRDLIKHNKTDVAHYSNLRPGNMYTFEISACRTDVQCVVCTESVSTKPNDPVCSQLDSNSILQNVEQTKIDFVTSNLHTTGASQYNVEVTTLDGPFTNLNYSASTTHSFEQLSAGVNYTFFIHAVGKDGGFSENECHMWHYTNPPTPGHIMFTNKTETTFVVSWEWEQDKNYDSFNVIVVNDKNQTKIKNITASNIATTVTGLHAGHCYQVNVSAVFLNQVGTPASSTTYCTVPSAPRSVKEISATTTTITISWEWDIGKDGEVDNFNITAYNIPHKTVMRQNTSQSSPAVLNDLQPGTCYYITVTSLFKSFPSKIAYVNSACTAPSAPSNVSIINQTMDSFIVTWKWLPKSGGVDHFNVMVMDKDSNQIVASIRAINNTSRLKLVTGLSAGHNYVAHVFADFDSRNSSESKSGQFFTVPDKPNPAVTATNDSVVIIFLDPNGHVDYYRLTGSCNMPNGTTGNYNITTNTSATIDNLIPGTCCFLEMFALLKNLISKPRVEENIRLNETVPGRVDGLTVNTLSSNAMELTWNPPMIKHGAIRKYSIIMQNQTCEAEYEITVHQNRSLCNHNQHENENINKFNYLMSEITKGKESHKSGCNGKGLQFTLISSAAVVNVSFTGLHPFTTYNFSIQAFTSAGGGQTVQQSNTTFEYFPSKPASITANVVNSTEIILDWNPPQEPNGLIVEYAIRFHYINSSVHEIQYKERFNMSGNILVKRTVTRYNVANLYYWSSYQFCVDASTKIGHGESICTVVRTNEYVPTSEVRNLQIQHKDHQSVTLIFNQPQYPNGKITGYIAEFSYRQCVCIEDLKEAQIITNTSATNVMEILLSDPMQITIDHLCSDWSYIFKVIAKTRVGVGTNWSQSITVITNGTKPGAVRKYDDNKIGVLNKTSTSLNIRWIAPCHPNGLVVKYHIKYKPVDAEKNQTVKTTSNSTTWLLSDLLPDTNYDVFVAAENNAVTLYSDYIKLLTAKTDIGVPYKPQQVTAKPLTSTSVDVVWMEAKLRTGPTTYTVSAVDKGINPEHKNWTCQVKGFHNTSCTVEELDEYWTYIFTVTATTSKGSNISEPSIPLKTKESTPGTVTHLNVTTPGDVTAPREVNITWSQPKTRDLNGNVTGYLVRCFRTNTGIVNSTTTTETYIKNFRLKPEQCYDFEVLAKTSIGNGLISRVTECVHAGAPIKPVESKSNPLIKTGPSVAVSNPEEQVSVELPLGFLCSTENGQPTEWGVIVSETSQVPKDDQPYFGTKKNYMMDKLQSYKKWADVHDADVIPPYVSTSSEWKPTCTQVNGRRKRSADGTDPTQTFVVGSAGDCNGVSGNCNGYLQPGKSYRVKSYVCTDGGCTETLYSSPISTEPNKIPGIVGGVAGAVVLFILCGAVLFVLRRKQIICFAPKGSKSGGKDNDAYDDFEMGSAKTRRPIKVDRFDQEMTSLMANSNMKLSEEYKMLKELSPTYATSVAERHVQKNRYTNILPFDHTRVKLLPLTDDCEDETDYINANYVSGYNSPREFIASQGPVESTTEDFWRMIWEQNVAVVVMLTQCVERGRIKCFKYWPDNVNEPKFYRDIIVEIERETKYPEYILRIINLQLGNSKKKVRHFAFLAWPDMGCPDTPTSLLNFVKCVRQSVPENMNGPITVHCSAGVGRTGTFIVVDHLLHQLDNECKEIDIFGLVLEKRKCRVNMVQTEDQYVYIYQCIQEYIEDEDAYENAVDGGHEEPVYENA